MGRLRIPTTIVKTHPLNTWLAWGGTCWGEEHSNWQHAISEVADLIAQHLNLRLSIIKAAKGHGGPNAFPDDIQTDIAFSSFAVGAVVGFALGQTYPTTVQELADWPAKAEELADLGNWRWLQEWLSKGTRPQAAGKGLVH